MTAMREAASQTKNMRVGSLEPATRHAQLGIYFLGNLLGIRTLQIGFECLLVETRHFYAGPGYDQRSSGDAHFHAGGFLLLQNFSPVSHLSVDRG